MFLPPSSSGLPVQLSHKTIQPNSERWVSCGIDQYHGNFDLNEGENRLAERTNFRLFQSHHGSQLRL